MWDSFLGSRKLESIIVYSPLREYETGLLEMFFSKLKHLLEEIRKLKIRDFGILIPQPCNVVFVYEENPPVIPASLPGNDALSLQTVKGASLKEAVTKIFPFSPQEISEEKLSLSPDKDFFLYWEAPAPFFEIEETLKLIHNHCLYLAEYSFSDIAIPGFLPVVCNVELAWKLEGKEVADYPWNWNELIIKNSQSFDVDIHYIEPDYRMYRFRLDLFSTREQKMAKNIISRYPDFSYRKIDTILKEDIQTLRIAPRYVEIEITTENPLKPKIYPVSGKNINMPLSLFRKILGDLQEFHLPESFVLSFAGTGDPLLHGDFLQFLKEALAFPLFKRIYVETYLTVYPEEIFTFLENYKKIIKWIIKIPTLKEKLYETLMGVPALPLVLENLQRIPDYIETYVEILRIQQVEEELDSIFSFFEKLRKPNIKPFLNKYNTYNLLPDFSVVDLEPLERDYCRSLFYHIFINSEGIVPVCRQDILCRYPYGNLHFQSLKEIFENLEREYMKFVSGDYRSISPFCQNCKDWYVYLE